MTNRIVKRFSSPNIEAVRAWLRQSARDAEKAGATSTFAATEYRDKQWHGEFCYYKHEETPK